MDRVIGLILVTQSGSCQPLHSSENGCDWSITSNKLPRNDWTRQVENAIKSADYQSANSHSCCVSIYKILVYLSCRYLWNLELRDIYSIYSIYNSYFSYSWISLSLWKLSSECLISIIFRWELNRSSFWEMTLK